MKSGKSKATFTKKNILGQTVLQTSARLPLAELTARVNGSS